MNWLDNLLFWLVRLGSWLDTAEKFRDLKKPPPFEIPTSDGPGLVTSNAPPEKPPELPTVGFKIDLSQPSEYTQRELDRDKWYTSPRGAPHAPVRRQRPDARDPVHGDHGRVRPRDERPEVTPLWLPPSSRTKSE